VICAAPDVAHRLNGRKRVIKVIVLHEMHASLGREPSLNSNRSAERIVGKQSKLHSDPSLLAGQTSARSADRVPETSAFALRVFRRYDQVVLGRPVSVLTKQLLYHCATPASAAPVYPPRRELDGISAGRLRELTGSVWYRN
jgi:hypothetical protein